MLIIPKLFVLVSYVNKAPTTMIGNEWKLVSVGRQYDTSYSSSSVIGGMSGGKAPRGSIDGTVYEGWMQYDEVLIGSLSFSDAKIGIWTRNPWSHCTFLLITWFLNRLNSGITLSIRLCALYVPTSLFSSPMRNTGCYLIIERNSDIALVQHGISYSSQAQRQRNLM